MEVGDSILFADLEDSQYKAYEFDYEKTVNKDHGRIEIRECWTISDPEGGPSSMERERRFAAPPSFSFTSRAISVPPRRPETRRRTPSAPREVLSMVWRFQAAAAGLAALAEMTSASPCSAHET